MAGTVRKDAKGFAKLVDTTACTLALDHDDLESAAQDLVEYGWGERAGPVAIVVSTALNLDMAVQPPLPHLHLGSARDWLESHLDSYRDFSPADAFSAASGLRRRALRTH